MNGRMAVSADGVTYQYVNNMPYSAFAISTVPEPATLVALGLGVAALLRRRRIIKV
jgi:hypothetical protein